MVVFVFGGSKSGKSDFAQNLSVEISDKKNLYYVATMIPCDGEDELRIKKHIESRSGLGFKTIECPYNLKEIFDGKENILGGTFLVESLTSLLSNIMFKNGETDFNSWEKLKVMLDEFVARAKNCVFVCDSIFSDAESYGMETEAFRHLLANASSFICGLSDIVVEVKNGYANFMKGGDKILQGSEREKKYFFVTGGAHNGKLEYAKKRFCLGSDDVCICKKDAEPDFSKRCIAYLENYIWFCMKNKIQPRMDWKKNTVFVATDIFCGVVPMEKDLREWREKTGEYFQMIAKESYCERVCFGLAQEMRG